jgi:endonuclease-3
MIFYLKVKRFHVLVSLMLSSQTKDEVTAKAMSQLQQIPLTIENILETSDDKLEKMIYPVSFYKRKVVYIKKTAQILKDTYNGDIPNNIEDLIKLPGVGPKMGYLTMTCAWNEVVGIGVDVIKITFFFYLNSMLKYIYIYI